MAIPMTLGLRATEEREKRATDTNRDDRLVALPRARACQSFCCCCFDIPAPYDCHSVHRERWQQGRFCGPRIVQTDEHTQTKLSNYYNDETEPRAAELAD